MKELYGKIKPDYQFDFALNYHVNCNSDEDLFSPHSIINRQMPWQPAEEEVMIQNRYNPDKVGLVNIDSKIRSI
jgi:hypothetical protein